uniref:Mutator family transposase n=1 Tax=Panagrellus redivivus TaxID=6233 RepID=A0A7E4VSL0_PANRE
MRFVCDMYSKVDDRRRTQILLYVAAGDLKSVAFSWSGELAEAAAKAVRQLGDGIRHDSIFRKWLERTIQGTRS